MTTAPRFTVPRDDRRECALYRIRVLDPRTNYTTVTLGYIGETGRMPFTRFMEHLYDQPWGDTIVGHPEVDPRVFNSKAEVLAAEKAATLAEKPLYPIEYQRGAPHQIPQWTAREQRAERDRAKGLRSPDWAAKGKAPRIDPAKPSHQPARKPQHLSAKWRRRRKWTLAWAGTVAMLWAALVLLDAAWLHWPVPALDWLDLSAGGVTALYVKLHVGRGKRRKLAWALTGVAMAAAAIWIARG